MTVSGGQSISYTYDNAGRVTQITQQIAAGYYWPWGGP
jgi:YD repeat-containing protein